MYFKPCSATVFMDLCSHITMMVLLVLHRICLQFTFCTSFTVFLLIKLKKNMLLILLACLSIVYLGNDPDMEDLMIQNATTASLLHYCKPDQFLSNIDLAFNYPGCFRFCVPLDRSNTYGSNEHVGPMKQILLIMAGLES